MTPVAAETSPVNWRELSQECTKRSAWSSAVGLSLSSCGLVASVLLFILVYRHIVPVPFNDHTLEQYAIFGLLPVGLMGLVVSSISWFWQRDKLSLIGIVLGILGIAAALFAVFVIIATGIAGHPL